SLSGSRAGAARAAPESTLRIFLGIGRPAGGRPNEFGTGSCDFRPRHRSPCRSRRGSRVVLLKAARKAASTRRTTMSFGKAKAIGYWAATSILALDFLAGGLASLARPPAVVAGMEHLGYPGYFGLILGAWKVLGAVALVAPRSPRL